MAFTPLSAVSALPSVKSANPIPKQEGPSFSQVLGDQFVQVAGQGRIIEGNLHLAVMGQGGLEHIAQDFAEFTAQLEAIKNIADAGISAVKQIVNTPL